MSKIFSTINHNHFLSNIYLQFFITLQFNNYFVKLTLVSSHNGFTNGNSVDTLAKEVTHYFSVSYKISFSKNDHKNNYKKKNSLTVEPGIDKIKNKNYLKSNANSIADTFKPI